MTVANKASHGFFTDVQGSSEILVDYDEFHGFVSDANWSLEIVAYCNESSDFAVDVSKSQVNASVFH